MGAAPPPQAALLVACWRIQPSSAPSPGSRRDPGSRRGKHICKPCTGTAHLHKRCRRTEDGRRLPVPKRQPTTPQKKTMFPSVSLQTKGKGPQLRLQSRVPKRVFYNIVIMYDVLLVLFIHSGFLPETVGRHT